MREDRTPPPRLDTGTWLDPGRGIAVHEQVLTEGVALHWHEFFELSYITEGAGEHILNGSRQPLGPGDTLALTPADFHEVRPVPGGTLHITNIVYTDDLLPAEVRALLPTPTLHLPELAADVARMPAEYRRTDALAALALSATLTRLLADVARAAAGRQPERPAARADVQRALVWLDHHFREPISLADAARVANLSPHHFSGLFRRTTGISFQDHLTSRRLAFARRLLTASGLPVTHVCHAAGFNDLTHFSRTYRRHFGHPPSADRRAG
ncbi:AraC family transcriptional regulator [Streptomyces sp. NPDC051940]|uniref:AraC family transcriptional regulator n=1 Tax=Streptomyces sp. NPDC051940 TaxID=3155675 RepID=UPI003432A439